MELGVKQGREIGEILNWLLEQVVEVPEYNDKDWLLGRVRDYLAGDRSSSTGRNL